jgi:hypothetical protein
MCIGLSTQTESGVVLIVSLCIGVSTQTPSGVVLRAVVQKIFIFIFEFFYSVYLNYEDVIKIFMM